MQNFLEQFFARARPGNFYLDIDIGLHPGEQNYLARKVYDLHGLPHVEHEYLALFRGIRDALNG